MIYKHLFIYLFNIYFVYSKRACVERLIDCGDSAKEMYIAAVNVESNMEIMDMSANCNSAAGIQVSLLAIAASLLLLFS